MMGRSKAVLSKLNKKLSEHAVLRTFVMLLACIVVFSVTFVMIIPAVTLEYSANADEPELVMYDTPMTLLGDGEVSYSSDLSDFVTSMDVTDIDGNPIEAGGDVTADTDYILTINFSESDYLQMQVNSEGVLTYKLPDSIKASAGSGNIVINSSTVIGTYVIDSDGNIKITPIRCDTTGAATADYFIDNYQNTKISLSFQAQVNNNGGLGPASIELGAGVTVTLRVVENGQLETEKTFLGIDYENHTMSYKYTVTGLNADVNNVRVYDVADYGQRFSMDNMVITYSDGTTTSVITNLFNEITPVPTTEKSDTAKANFPEEDEGFSSTETSNPPTNDKDIAFYVSGGLSNSKSEMVAILGTVHPGETYSFIYSLSIPDNIYYSNSYKRMNNSVETTGTNTDGDTVDETCKSPEQVVNLVFLKKYGKQVTSSDGADQARWSIMLGDKQTEVTSRTITDTISSNCSYDTSGNLSVEYYDLDNNNKSKTIYVSWDDVTVIDNEDGTQSFSINLPINGERASYYSITYLSDYTLEGSTGTVTNTASDSVFGKTVTEKLGVTASKPTVYKRASFSSDGERIHYEITFTIPAGFNKLSDFHIEDCLEFQKNDIAGTNWYVDAEWSNVSLVVTGKSGTVYNLTPYESGDPADTYLVQVQSGNENKNHHIYFNTADGTSSTWSISEYCTMVLTYEIPIDCPLIKADYGKSYITNDDYTSLYLLKNNVPLRNWVSAYYDGSEESNNVDIKLNTVKTSKQISSGVAEYQVKFNNYRDGYSYTPSKASGSSRIDYVEGFAFVDDFDESLQYVDGTLKLRLDNTYLVDGETEYRYAIFDYKGDSTAFNSNHEILAAAEDFYINADETTNWMTNDWALKNVGTCLADFLKGNIGYHEYTFTAIYNMELTDTAKQQVASAVKVSNEGYFKWTGGMTNKGYETTSLDTGLMSKTYVQNGDKLDYTILLNPGRMDLLEDNDIIRVKDTMSGNLSVYWDTIKVYYYDDDAGWVEMNALSGTYRCTTSYDSDSNSLIFEVPDSQYLKFVYTTLITETGTVSVNNTVNLVGYGDIVKVSEAQFAVAKSGGTASAGDLGFTLTKSSTDGKMLSGASFAVYTEVSNPTDKDENPYGAPASFTTNDAYGNSVTLYYYKTYTTGDDGTVYIESQYFYDDHTYAVYEANAPTGYKQLTEPVIFNLNPNALQRDIDMQQVSNMLSIVDTPVGYVLPSTGGAGTYFVYTAGSILIITGFIFTIFRKKKQHCK